MSKSFPPSQNFIDIQSIKQDAIILRGGGLRKVLLVNGVNFDLQSEEEQGMIIYAFQNFLNSLKFSIQIFIHSRKLNIEQYLKKLTTRQKEESVDLLKNIITDYQEYIKSFVSQNAIMEKNFFVVVPFDPIQATVVGKVFFKKLAGWIKRKPVASEETAAVSKKALEQSFQQLNQRVDSVISGLAQIGLRAAVVNEKELSELFYNLYNPESVERRL